MELGFCGSVVPCVSSVGVLAEDDDDDIDDGADDDDNDDAVGAVGAGDDGVGAGEDAVGAGDDDDAVGAGDDADEADGLVGGRTGTRTVTVRDRETSQSSQPSFSSSARKSLDEAVIMIQGPPSVSSLLAVGPGREGDDVDVDVAAGGMGRPKRYIK